MDTLQQCGMQEFIGQAKWIMHNEFIQRKYIVGLERGLYY